METVAPSKKETLVSTTDTTTQISTPNSNSKRAARNILDFLIEDYIARSNKSLIKWARTNKLLEEWLFDQTISTDTATYFVFQIGHDEMDDGKMNKRFVTDQWIYVDSATQRLYEYDVAADSLHYWKDNRY